jgi:hypothetical protein
MMAKADLTDNFGFADRRNTTAAQAISSTTATATPLNYNDITKLRTRLTAINGARYTSTYLDIMTKNDMVYALRTLDDAAGI